MLLNAANRHRFIVTLFCIAFAACSAKKTAPTDESGMDSSSTVSNADKVEGNTDDMLASESGGDNSEMKELSGDSDDPFADLKSESKTNETTPNADSSANLAENSGPGSVSADGTAMPEANSLSGDSSNMATTSPTDFNQASGRDNSAGGEMRIYTVKAGDTLMTIAFSIYGDLDRWKDLHDWNSSKIKNPNRLARGMKIKYEAPSEEFQVEEHAQNYVIKKGDTLAKIADEVYGRIRKWKKLQRYNARLIKNPNVIFAGFKLYYEITPLEVAEAQKRREEREALAASKNQSAVLADTMNAKPVIAKQEKAPPKPAAIAAEIGKKIEPVLNASAKAIAPTVNAAEKVPSVITGGEVKPVQPAAIATASPTISPVTPAPQQSPAVVTPVTK